jgi:hypothetical protein
VQTEIKEIKEVRHWADWGQSGLMKRGGEERRNRTWIKNIPEMIGNFRFNRH